MKKMRKRKKMSKRLKQQLNLIQIITTMLFKEIQEVVLGPEHNPVEVRELPGLVECQDMDQCSPTIHLEKLEHSLLKRLIIMMHYAKQIILMMTTMLCILNILQFCFDSVMLLLRIRLCQSASPCLTICLGLRPM